jgi:hypothetical protein
MQLDYGKASVCNYRGKLVFARPSYRVSQAAIRPATRSLLR